MKPTRCCRSLDDVQSCKHKQRFKDAAAYIESQGITIHYAPTGASEEAWRSGQRDVAYKTISIWPTAFGLFGWDRVTSVLIHEFGHCKLYEAEGLWLASVEVERKANEYGFQLMPPEMIPESYHADRSFSLQTYKDVAAFTTGQQVLKAFEEWDGKPVPEYGQAPRASTARLAFEKTAPVSRKYRGLGHRGGGRAA